MESQEFEPEEDLDDVDADLDDEFEDESDSVNIAGGLDQDIEDDLDEDIDEDIDVDSDDEDYTQAPTKPVIAMATLPITGEPRVDDAMARLTDLANLPVHEHVEVFEDVQRRLHETLADLSGQ